MKLMTFIAASLFSVGAFAQLEITKQNIIVCTASAYQNEATLSLETVKNVQVYALGTDGELLDAGIVGAPFALTQTLSVPGFNGDFTNSYTVDGTNLLATIVFSKGDAISIQVGTDEFSAPVLVKDQKTTDDIVASGAAGFTCSRGDVMIKDPVPGLARP